MHKNIRENDTYNYQNRENEKIWHSFYGMNAGRGCCFMPFLLLKKKIMAASVMGEAGWEWQRICPAFFALAFFAAMLYNCIV